MPDLTADMPKVLLVATNGKCSLFIDGKLRRPMADRGRILNADSLDVTPMVRELADLADVPLFVGLDPRYLFRGEPAAAEHRLEWRPTLAEVVERKEQIEAAAKLRADAKQLERDAEKLERRP